MKPDHVAPPTFERCPGCGATVHRHIPEQPLSIYRCSCGRMYCDNCSGGGLITLPRCPISVYHEGMMQVGTIPESAATSAPAAEVATSRSPSTSSTVADAERGRVSHDEPTAGGRVEAQADSLEAAREALRSRVAPGCVLLDEEVVDDGASRMLRAEAATLEEAFAKAREELPADATIEAEKVLRQPAREMVEVVAFEKEEALQRAAVRHPRAIQSISLKEPGRKGVFGIGRRPGTFALEVVRSAEVGITYRRPITIRATVATAEMIPVLKATFWDRGGPIRREELYREQRSAAAGLFQFAAAGHLSAVEEVRSIVANATATLRDIGEFSRYHGYQRQQVAAQLLGLVGTPANIPDLEEALRLQDTYAGSSEYSNRTSTKPQVERTVEAAIASLRSRR